MTNSSDQPFQIPRWVALQAMSPSMCKIDMAAGPLPWKRRQLRSRFTSLYGTWLDCCDVTSDSAAQAAPRYLPHDPEWTGYSERGQEWAHQKIKRDALEISRDQKHSGEWIHVYVSYQKKVPHMYFTQNQFPASPCHLSIAHPSRT